MAVSPIVGPILSLLFFVFIVMIFLFKTRVRGPRQSYTDTMTAIRQKREQRLQSTIIENTVDRTSENDILMKTTDITSEDINFVEIERFGRIRVCCNQTARLNEQYCLCGRVVPEKLRKFYNP